MGDDRWSCSPLLNSATGLRGQESTSTVWPEAQLIDTDAHVLQTRQSPYGLQQVNGVQRWTHCDYEEEEIQSNLCHVFAATVNVTGCALYYILQKQCILLEVFSKIQFRRYEYHFRIQCWEIKWTGSSKCGIYFSDFNFKILHMKVPSFKSNPFPMQFNFSSITCFVSAPMSGGGGWGGGGDEGGTCENQRQANRDRGSKPIFRRAVQWRQVGFGCEKPADHSVHLWACESDLRTASCCVCFWTKHLALYCCLAKTWQQYEIKTCCYISFSFYLS